MEAQNNQNERLWRTQSGMVLLELENALGKFILDKQFTLEDFDRAFIEQMSSRTPSYRRRSINTLNDIVQQSYIDDVFQLACKIPLEHALKDKFREAYDLARVLGIFEIRTKNFHPNRPFLENYWHRVSAFVTDPCVMSLGFNSVVAEFRKAQEGTLVELPFDWIQKYSYQIPNNLPNTYSHRLTGLIGRNTDIRELKRRILSPKSPLVAIAAPGGLGKTALVLETLEQLSGDPDFIEHFDGILFVTAKTQDLTTEGKKQVRQDVNLHEIEAECLREYESLFQRDSGSCASIEEAGENKVLLVTDNMEEILLRTPGAFEVFYDRVPEQWKVVVTSRIPVSNASTIALKPLDDRDSEKLARVYSAKRNISLGDPERFVNLAVQCKNNPLAIRLAIDAFGLGKDFQSSIEKTLTDIADFSYANLVEALSDDAMLMLEVLFAEGEATRDGVRNLLSVSIEKAAGAASELLRTSLVDRREDEDGNEILFLTNGVRDLLLGNARNIEFRVKVKRHIQSANHSVAEVEKYQNRLGISNFQWLFLSQTLPTSALVRLHKEQQLIRRGRISANDIAQSRRRIDAIKNEYPNLPECYAYLAWAHHKLEDLGQALEFSSYAVDLSDRNIRFLDQFAALKRQARDFQGSTETNLEILTSDEFHVALQKDTKFTARVIFNYFQCMVYDGRIDEALESTKHWKTLPHRSVYGSMRAWAIKRKAERDAVEDRVGELLRSVRILNDCLENDREEGTDRPVFFAARNIIEEIAHISGTLLGRDEAVELLSFASNYVHKAFTTDGDKTDQMLLIVQKISAATVLENPFRSPFWISVLSRAMEGAQLENSDLEHGWLRAIVYNIPPKKPEIVFANDDQGTQYYCHLDRVDTKQHHLWGALRIGSKLDIKPSKDIVPGKTRAATSIKLVSV